MGYFFALNWKFILDGPILILDLYSATQNIKELKMLRCTLVDSSKRNPSYVLFL